MPTAPIPVLANTINQAFLTMNRQDVVPGGLRPPPEFNILGASSDHLVVGSGPRRLPVGAEVIFELNRRALLCATTSPYVAKIASPITS